MVLLRFDLQAVFTNMVQYRFNLIKFVIFVLFQILLAVVTHMKKFSERLNSQIPYARPIR